MNTTIDDLVRIHFSQHRSNGVLTVMSSSDGEVPFPIARLFTITGVASGSSRANHAHRWCSQLHVCISGQVDILIQDGKRELKTVLKPDGVGLLVPPLLWGTFSFQGPTAVLAVFCDHLYDPADYIHSWDEFKELKKIGVDWS